jgi:predicted component of type VI protein secretion system
MTLVLHGITLNEQPMSKPLIGRFDERGGTLGRSDKVTFTLPDPERTISRIQAQVLHHDEGYWIENVSPANPILHNGRPLSAGMRVMLRQGDELAIGGYTLQVSFEDDAESASILHGRTLVLHPQPSPAASPEGAAGSRTPAPVAGNAEQAASAFGRPRQNSASDGLLWRAFLEGLAIDFPENPSAELLRSLGEMMRIATEGLYRLLAMRATAKDEMQAQMTMIQARAGNPLKFAPDATIALRLLLKPPARAFLSGPAALRDALTDLQSHQVAVMAGMRAALESVLDRFDPPKLEQALGTPSLLDSLRPAHRKAQLWELYLNHYGSLRAEAQEDFQRFFGAAFREAYEAQARSLEAASAVTAPVRPTKGGGSR